MRQASVIAEQKRFIGDQARVTANSAMGAARTLAQKSTNHACAAGSDSGLPPDGTASCSPSTSYTYNSTRTAGSQEWTSSDQHSIPLN